MKTNECKVGVSAIMKKSTPHMLYDKYEIDFRRSNIDQECRPRSVAEFNAGGRRHYVEEGTLLTCVSRVNDMAQARSVWMVTDPSSSHHGKFLVAGHDYHGLKGNGRCWFKGFWLRELNTDLTNHCIC
jgi:hypothetical protein